MPKAGYGDIFNLVGDYQMLSDPKLIRYAVILFVSIELVIVVHIVGGEKGSVHFKVKLNSGSELECSCLKYTCGDDHATAARIVAGVNSLLYGFCVQHFSVSYSAVIRYVGDPMICSLRLKIL